MKMGGGEGINAWVRHCGQQTLKDRDMTRRKSETRLLSYFVHLLIDAFILRLPHKVAANPVCQCKTSAEENAATLRLLNDIIKAKVRV